MNTVNRLLLVLLATTLFSLGVYAGYQPHTLEDIERRAFLAGASASWHPGIDQWVFDTIDRRDPDWEEAFQAWKKAEPK